MVAPCLCDFFLRIIVGPVFADVALWWSGTEKLLMCSKFQSSPRVWFSLLRVLVVLFSTLS